jgi:hypothetical protein
MIVDATVLPNGNLVLTADPETREEIDRAGLDLHALLESYWANGSYTPFDAGNANPFVGLTSAPCIAERMTTLDDGTNEIDGRLWWFPNYAVECPIETLAKSGRVVFSAVS